MDSSRESAERAELNAPEIRPSGLADQPDRGDHRTYTRAKHAVAAVVRRLDAYFRHGGDEPRAEACRDLMVKLAEDCFTLAVLGELNRGKRSLINALMGRQILPTGVLPLTSAITVLRFGSRERLVVKRKGWPSAESAPLNPKGVRVAMES
jgi:Dynamin family